MSDAIEDNAERGETMSDYKYRVIDRDENIIWTGSGRKEAQTAFKEAKKQITKNFIRLQELKKGVYVTQTATCV